MADAITADTANAALRSAGVTVLERGWLSANNVLVRGDGPTALIDSGYCTHAEQTLALVAQALGGAALDLLLNTHLHSDHCGGNAALQQAYPGVATHIPPGLAQAVADWDPVALTFQPTGQDCPPFRHDALLQPGSSVRLGACDWEVHAAKGHDPHAVLLFQAEHRLLLSADALWEHGFGVVFPELEGVDAFDEVADTLDLIERLDPVTVVPGHGRVFRDVAAALQRARSRLNKFVTDPASHLRHGYKVLIKFKLLESRQMELDALYRWCEQTPYLRAALQKQGGDPAAQRRWLDGLLADLGRSQALRIENGQVFNT